jgi:hypothetical protein
VTKVLSVALAPVRLKVTAVAVAGTRDDRSMVRVAPGPSAPPELRVSSTRAGDSDVNFAAAAGA